MGLAILPLKIRLLFLISTCTGLSHCQDHTMLSESAITLQTPLLSLLHSCSAIVFEGFCGEIKMCCWRVLMRAASPGCNLVDTIRKIGPYELHLNYIRALKADPWHTDTGHTLRAEYSCTVDRLGLCLWRILSEIQRQEWLNILVYEQTESRTASWRGQVRSWMFFLCQKHTHKLSLIQTETHLCTFPHARWCATMPI